MYTNFLLPYITSPSRVTPRSQTLIDNFFSNIIEEGSKSGNLTTTRSDHFVQFVLLKTEKTIKCNSKDTKNIRDFKNLNKENFESDVKETKCDEILELSKGNVDLSSENVLKTFDSIIDRHLLLRKLTIQGKKFSQKPWITTRILNSIKNKNRKYRKYQWAKDATRKHELHNEFKTYRNKLDKVLKSSKSIHYQKFFEANKTNLRKTREGIREVTNVKRRHPQTISRLMINGNTIADPSKVASHFTSYFSNVGKNIANKIPKANQNYREYLKEPIEYSFILHQTTNEEIESVLKNLKNNNGLDQTASQQWYLNTSEKQ